MAPCQTGSARPRDPSVASRASKPLSALLALRSSRARHRVRAMVERVKSVDLCHLDGARRTAAEGAAWRGQPRCRESERDDGEGAQAMARVAQPEGPGPDVGCPGSKLSVEAAAAGASLRASARTGTLSNSFPVGGGHVHKLARARTPAKAGPARDRIGDVELRHHHEVT